MQMPHPEACLNSSWRLALWSLLADMDSAKASPHWEMWSFARGGMSPVQALRTATTEPARHLGFDKDIGSLEKGKLADLVILSDNPLEDIRNTDKVEHVMLGGRLYESETMNEVHTGDSKRLPYWWE